MATAKRNVYTPPVKPVTVKVPAAEFMSALKDAAVFQCTDDTLPGISCVFIDVKDRELRLAATDRYRIGVSTIPIRRTRRTVFPLDADGQKRLLATFAPSKKSRDPVGVLPLELTFSADGLSVANAEATLRFVPPSYFTADGGHIVTWESILVSTRDQITKSKGRGTAPYGFNPEFLTSFAKVTAGIPNPSLRPLRLSISAPNKPALIEIGERFTGLIMPVRLSG